MAITVSAPNNISSPNGNSLALYKDASTGLFYVKDINGQIEQFALSSGFVSGSGTTGRIPVWQDASTIANSNMYESSPSGIRNIGIGTTAPTEKLQVRGTIYATPIGFSANQDAYALKFGARNNVSYDMGIKIKSNTTGGAYMSICSNISEDVIVIRRDFVGIDVAEPLSTEKMRVNGTISVDVRNPSAYGFRAVASNGTTMSGIRYNNNDGELRLENGAGVKTISLKSETISYINGGNLGIGTTTPQSKIEVDGGDIGVKGSTNGVILESPDATRYRIQVENGGTLSVTAV